MDVPTRIEADRSSLTLSWENGRSSVISARALRAACPCASCREPDGAARTTQVLAGLMAITIGDVSLVGDYAISIGFGPDGHSTGIFPFPLLQTLGTDAA